MRRGRGCGQEGLPSLGLFPRAGRLDGCQVRQGAEWGRGTGGGFWSGYLWEARWTLHVILDKVGGWRGGAGQAGPPSTCRQGGAALGRQELAVVTKSPPEEQGFGSSSGCGPPPPRAPHPLRPSPAHREHHDRVLHDGADAGLGRGLLHLQPHEGCPPELPAPLRRQRLLPGWPLSPTWGGPPGLPPIPACSAWGRPAASLCRSHHFLRALWPQGSAWLSDMLPRVRLCSALRLTPAPAPHPCLAGPALWGVTHSRPCQGEQTASPCPLLGPL